MKSRTAIILSGSYLALFVGSLVVFLTAGHGHTVLLVNRHRQPLLDMIMPFWTHLGDGWFFSIAVLVLLLIRWRSGLVLLALGISQLLMSAFLKRVVFRGSPRPKTYFEEMGITLDLIEGVKVHAYNAFPSGHTMTAFGIATFFALYTGSLRVGMIGLFLAVSVGFSRIYLSQHFLIDVAVGSLVGLLLGIFICYVFRKTLLLDVRQTLF